MTAPLPVSPSPGMTVTSYKPSSHYQSRGMQTPSEPEDADQGRKGGGLLPPARVIEGASCPSLGASTEATASRGSRRRTRPAGLFRRPDISSKVSPTSENAGRRHP